MTMAVLAAALSAVLSLWLWVREPHSLPARLLGAGLCLLAIDSVLAATSATALLPEHMIAWQRARMLAASVAPGVWLAFSLVYARTNYREFLRAWRVPLVLLVAGPPLLAVAGWKHLVVGVSMAEDRIYWGLQLGLTSYGLRVAGILGAALIVANLEQTYRESRGTTRWRIKSLLAGVFLMFLLRIFFDGQALLVREWDPALEPVLALGLIAGSLLILRSLYRSPRLQVDLYVSTPMLFGSLTVVLIAAYLLALGVAAHLWRRGGRDAAGLLAAALLVASLALLVVLVMSDRARVTARRFLTRHLQRPAFDYRQLWHDFSERTLRAMSVADVAREASRFASETFEALSVSVWLLDERQHLRLAASTSLPAADPAAPAQDFALPEAMAAWQRAALPLDLERESGAWADWAREANPAQFPEGGNRFGMPLKAEETVLGLMVLGDRVRGWPLSGEELDLFRILASQTAVRLQTVRMAERLLEAKQWEAFQTMSAFLAHDLKNTASGLSLTLQNLRSYFDDPGFRADAERSIGAGVRKMSELIRRLSSLRQSLDLHVRPMDLTAWTAERLRELDATLEGRLHWVPGPALPVRMDPEPMQAVLVNLVLNARDASSPPAPVEVRTAVHEGWAAVLVTDQGCGMSAEFLEQKLFRPFQTTKKEGMGIGLFQARKVVEAHGGRVDVESAVGQGSTFRVLLPLEETPQ